MERKEVIKMLPSISKDAIEDMGFGVGNIPFGDIGLHLPIPTFKMGIEGLTRLFGFREVKCIY